MCQYCRAIKLKALSLRRYARSMLSVKILSNLVVKANC